MTTRVTAARRFASALGGVAVLMLALVAAASGARADDIPRLGGPVTDVTTGQVLAADRARIETRIDELLRADDVQLFVLFVETTGSYTVTGFADDTARINSLGGNDMLLVVALTDRTDALWRSDFLGDRFTDAELQTVLTQRVEPRLRDGDYGGAVVAGADGLSAAGAKPAEATAGPIPTSAPVATPDLGFALPLVLLLAGAVLLWSVLAARRREAKADASRTGEANALLIRADEALRDAQQELGYAEAQFAPTEVTPFREALDAASVELRAAFTARQQLDDEVPEDAAARRRLVDDVATRSSKALALLEEQRARVEEMRDVERRAPELLAELRTSMDAAAARLPRAEQALAGLARYAERSAAPVARNVADARALVTRCASEVGSGETALAAGDRAVAARAVRAGRQDLLAAAKLLDAIDALAAAIRDAERAAPEKIAEAARDLEKAQAALASAGTADQGKRLAEARAALERARGELAAPRPDVFAALRLAGDADGAADTVLAELRQEEEKREREARLVATHLQLASGSYERARDYITPRRRTIGSTARTRLAEAERHLGRARQLADASDGANALAEAKRAQQLADEAWSLAQDDVGATEARGPWTSSPRSAADVIVPLLIGAALGRRGGGWGRMGGGRSVGGVFGGGIGRPSGGGRSVGGRW